MVGKKYRLGRSVRAVHADGFEKGFVLLPEGAVLVVNSYHDDSRILRVKWNGKDLFVFAQDVLERAQESKG
jgi:hypothetical protein